MRVIDLANMNATATNRGTFKALVRRLRIDYSSFALYIENVMTQQFCDGLLRIGFKQVQPNVGLPCFYMLSGDINAAPTGGARK